MGWRTWDTAHSWVLRPLFILDFQNLISLQRNWSWPWSMDWKSCVAWFNNFSTTSEPRDKYVSCAEDTAEFTIELIANWSLFLVHRTGQFSTSDFFRAKQLFSFVLTRLVPHGLIWKLWNESLRAEKIASWKPALQHLQRWLSGGYSAALIVIASAFQHWGHSSLMALVLKTPVRPGFSPNILRFHPLAMLTCTMLLVA